MTVKPKYMKSPKTPGVYLEETTSFPVSVSSVPSSIPAFIGYTQEDSLRNIPTKINSLQEYRDKFGGAPLQAFSLKLTDIFTNAKLSSRTYTVDDPHPGIFKLYHSLELYFSNGGGPCYIVSVGNYEAEKIEVGKRDPLEGLLGGIKATETIDEISLLVFPDAISLANEIEYGFVVKDALALCHKLRDRFTICDVYDNKSPSAINDFRQAIGTNYLKYGAAYYPSLKTAFKYTANEENSVIIHTKIEDTGSPVNSRFHKKSLREVKDLDDLVYRSFKNEINNKYISLPPSGAIAGVYVNVDTQRGVWKAPANISLNSVIEPTVNITQNQQESLNVDAIAGKSINAIRTFSGRGVLVWGARTLAGNDNESRYVSMQRLYINIEESVKKALQQFRFEANALPTWSSVKAMIENYLLNLWREGALAGTKPEHAFFVKIGLNETMSSQDILENKMIVQIGLAPMRPAEFTILKISCEMKTS